MTEQVDTASDIKRAGDKASDVLGELGPVIAFIAIYNGLLQFAPKDGLISGATAIYWATGGLMASVAAVIVVKLAKGRKIPPFMLISSAIIGVFGLIGIVFQSKVFLFIKPTIINLMYAGVIFGGLAVGRNIWKMLFRTIFDLPDFAWRTLAIRWGLFFIAMAVWNEVLWRNFSEAVWANWKLLNMGVTVIFMIANTPYTLKHLRE